MNKVLKKEDLFYDMSRLLTDSLLAQNPDQLDSDKNFVFRINSLDSIPPIQIEIFTKASMEEDEFYSGFATCGRKMTTSHNSDFLDEIIKDILFEILMMAYSIDADF